VGLKIRVMKSKTMMDMVDALGGSPTPIPWGELYTALQQKMVDGAENNPPSFYTNRHFEVAKHFTLDEHSRVPDILLISKPIWDGLSPQQQRWVEEAAVESSRFQRKLWEEKTREALEEVQKEGVTIYRPSKEPFSSRVEAMHRSYAGSSVGELLQRIKETP
jgi:TRAP-type C4-dicarboxylate transport system substrate-binding protein